MAELHVNESDLLAILRTRQEFAAQFGGVLDQKRPTAWIQYGYPEKVTFDHLYRAYERGGAGFGAVHKLLDKTWQELPRIKQPESDEETPWEEKVEATLCKAKAWLKLRDTDRRNLVGRFSAVVYRVADGRKLSEPVGKAKRLVDLLPLFENQIRVTKWQDDTTADDYAQPLMFQVRTRPPGEFDTQAQPETWVDVHPSRVQILAEGSSGNFLDGVPLLRAGFNALVDLEKITGGSAEGFLKNASRQVVFKYDANAAPSAINTTPEPGAPAMTVREAHEAQVRSLNRNIDSAIVLQGADATTLPTSMPQPEEPWSIAANTFAASVQIPMTILFGQMTGRLASDQDQKDFQARAKTRRENELTPFLTEFVERMQAIGVLEAGEFEVEWPPIDAPGDDAKLDQAAKMATINKATSEGGQGPAFSVTEIRRVADYDEPMEPDPLPPLGEGDPGDGDPSSADPAGPAAPAGAQQQGAQPPMQ